MNIPGPIAVQSLDPAQRHDLALRPFQRITAEVLQVSSTQAILSVDGYPIVAQLTSADQAALLKTARQAQFVVSQMDDQTIVLRFLRPTSAGTGAAAPGVDVARADLATQLLNQLGQPPSAENLLLARAALGHRLLVSAELFQELSTALAGLGSWGEAEAELAAALKAAGLPLSPGSLQLAARGGEQVGDGMARLMLLLQQAAQDPDLPETLRLALQQNLLLLDGGVVDWNAGAENIAAKLQSAVELLGRSLENILKSQAQEKSPFWPEKSLVQLTRMQELFRQAGRPELAEVVDRFLDDARMGHLMNARTELQPGRNEWAQVGFMLRLPDRGPEPEVFPARLRIARQSGSKTKIDPAFTRLMIQVDLEGGEVMEADVTLVNKQIRAAVTAPNQELCERAREEMPGLREALEKLGFALQESQVGVGTPPPFEIIDSRPVPGEGLLSVDLEV
jgi:hypothetical protein